MADTSADLFVYEDLRVPHKIWEHNIILRCKASTIEVDDDIYIIVINKERVLDRIENTVTIYKFDKDFKSFYVSSTLPEINPVGVSTISYQHHHFLALAGGHLPESVDNSIVTIFRLNRENDVMVRYQSLLVENPVNVHLDFLPTSELVLYVLSLNPAKPFTVFLYRGVQGFVEETSGPSLYTGERLDSFTNDAKQHFVTISGFGRGQVLRAGFKAHNGYIQAENNEEDGEFQMAMTLTHNVNNQQLFFDVSLNEQVLSGNQACQQELHF